ncbi:MAG: hypothetical protein JWO03_3637, partial [Bacteroidetes bacterium]|nr:hypothetical protein [Bacteroidota bacterium]
MKIMKYSILASAGLALCILLFSSSCKKD